MQHSELVALAVRWKTKGCPFVFAALVTLQSEERGAIGWRNSGSQSFLIECKNSRSDLLADKRKPHRWRNRLAMDTFRYYLCPLRPSRSFAAATHGATTRSRTSFGCYGPR